jgi:RNA polymerase sigma-70 factor (ECF subfamily)
MQEQNVQSGSRKSFRETELSDQSLVRLLRLGNQDAATALYHRYARRVNELARSCCGADLSSRLDTEDIVQSVFRCFFRGVSRGQYDVPAEAELWGLLMVIAVNKVRAQGNYHRAACRDVGLTVSSSVVGQQISSKTDSDPNSLAFLRMVIDETLEALPEWRRQIVSMRIDGYEIAEITERSGRPRRTVERVLHEFRHQLSMVLREDGE